ncbi:MAG: hypothetical protein ACOC3G_04475 [Phycisphaeraceae bacterium]
MPQNDEQLVQQVVQRVLAALERRESGGSAPVAGGGASASIRPPAGVCTGDYSQFKDRPDLAGASPQAGGERSEAPDSRPQAGAERSEAPGRSTPANLSTPAQPPALTGIVTAEQLRAAAAAAADGRARLDAKARLTPLANDLVRESPELMVRLGTSPSAAGAAGAAGALASSAAATTPAAGSPWLWWADGHCPGVQTLTHQRRDALRPSAARRDQAGLSQVIRDIALGVHGQTLTGGVLFVRSACRPLLLANRCPNLRAVSSHRPDLLEQAVAELSPNVLILEYPRLSGEMMASLVEKVLAHQPHAPAVLSRELRELAHLT